MVKIFRHRDIICNETIRRISMYIQRTFTSLHAHFYLFHTRGGAIVIEKTIRGSRSGQQNKSNVRDNNIIHTIIIIIISFSYFTRSARVCLTISAAEHKRRCRRHRFIIIYALAAAMYYSRAVNGYFFIFIFFLFLHTYYIITYIMYKCVPLRSEGNIILYFYIQARAYDCVYIMHARVCVCTGK